MLQINIDEYKDTAAIIADYDLNDYEESDILCLNCKKANFRIMPEEISVDDFTNYLKCPNCLWEERE